MIAAPLNIRIARRGCDAGGMLLSRSGHEAESSSSSAAQPESDCSEVCLTACGSGARHLRCGIAGLKS